MNTMVTINVDGRTIEAEAGRNLMEVALEHGIFIPGLCQFTGLDSVGACRLCVVELKDVPRLLPACSTLVADGMEVYTDTEKVQTYRKMILELLFAERNHVCSICVANGHCELQSLAERLGVHHVRYPYRYPTHHIDATHSRFAFDPNRCVLCTRCVRVCEDVEGAKTWGVRGRGIQSNVMTDLDGEWGESETCTSCSKCVHVCPTGALYEKGKATGEMIKRDNILPYLQTMRANAR